MITKVKTNSHEEWLEERKKSLGGSDMGAILGMNPYSSAYTVWAEKTGKLPPFEGTEWTRLGNDLEGYVAQRFTEASGMKVSVDKATWRNSKYPHLHANIDRKVVGQKAGLECKVTSELNAKKYKDGEFPDRFYAQCCEYLLVTEYDRWYLTVLIYGKGVKIYQMTRIKDDIIPEWCEASVYVDDAEQTRDELCNDSCKTCAVGIHSEKNDENEVEDYVDDTRDDEEVKRSARVTERADHV
jgi:putative phage-type endonuclease